MSHRSTRFTLPAAAAIAAAIALSPAYGSTITYSNLSAFQAASTIPAANNITFEFIAAPGGQASFNTSSGLLTGPTGAKVQFLGCSPSCDSTSPLPSYSLAVDNASTGNWDFWGPSSPNSVLDAPGGPTHYLQVNVLPSSTAVGFSIMTAFAAAQPVSVTVGTSSGSQTFSNIATQANPTEQFWGVTTDLPITSLVIQAPGSASHVFLDNFLYGQSNTQQVPEVPEAVTSLLIGGGLILLRALKKLFPTSV